ncbi:fungal-specific transcription factor domain-containing protein [Thelonectria olida]|uniref:Fungal-specific transcription factor domain-containing protein n=1 Tax=Thelonectria olida TaxID=1576542 RepID=A0A9P9AV29_9HYPO|nr:fungal-specific transcription factor domain-containing protein [Thelonectria olida]
MTPPSTTDRQSQARTALTSDVADRFSTEMERLDVSSIGDVVTQTAHEQSPAKETEGEITWLGGVNAHTQGTEFYGGSSNLAFLNTLFARARTRVRSCSREPGAPAHEEDSVVDENSPGHLQNSQLSIVNLMYNADSATIRSPPSSSASKAQDNTTLPPSPSTARSEPPSLGVTETRSSNKHNLDVEKYFIDSYFSNKHHIHPFLDENHFRDRCMQLSSPHIDLTPSKRSSTFRSLYYAVVAVGAINAPMNEGPNLNHSNQSWHTKQAPLHYANWYFDLAHRALGNTFEISTLETCQALFLLTVFCQNALKPHSCYLYSGMAVRTAIAIGLTNETYGNTLAVAQEARRTWWCIYSHEVEMCCSSGRVDGLKDPRHYSTPLPSWTTSSELALCSSELAIIPVMVDLARILREASLDIYHDVSERSLRKKSQIAFKLDTALDSWKRQLPSFLDLESFALDEAEWAFKQKLVLKFRSYNARILIHRPFLVASSASYDSSEFSRHVEICLDASRATIQVIHESLAHRPYLRAWWYCTTYTLYATMIILHLVLLDFPKVPGEELVEDVEKSLEIFSVMAKSVTVAKRCGELTQEILGVAKRYLRGRNDRQTTTANVTPPSIPDDIRVSADIFGGTLPNVDEIWDDEHLIALLNQDEPGPSRANALADFLDPSILQGFVAGDGFS